MRRTVPSHAGELLHRSFSTVFGAVCCLCGEPSRYASLCRSCAVAAEIPHFGGQTIETSPPLHKLHYCAEYAPVLPLRARSPLQELLHGFKYQDQRAAGRGLGCIFAKVMAPLVRGNFTIVPIPLAPLRLARRGFNQAGWLAKALASRSGLAVNCKVITRCEGATPQLTLGAAERRRNLRGVFRIGPRRVNRLGPVLLVDDVTTTGTTLEECARVLRRAGVCQVEAAVLLRTRLRHTPVREPRG
jgi:ComF family protein